MRLRVFPFVLFLLMLSASGCAVVLKYFMVVSPISVVGCIISVHVPAKIAVDYGPENIFVNDLDIVDGISIRSMYDVGRSDEFTVPRDEYLELDGMYNVRRFSYESGTWYFEVLADGNRTALYTPNLFGGIEERHNTDITDIGWVWVKGNYVEEFDEHALELQCDGEIIDLLNFSSETVTRFYQCIVNVTDVDTPTRVGPGENRSIRAFISPIDEGYGVNASATDDEGNLWYELDVPNRGFLWVLQSQTSDFDFITFTDTITDTFYIGDCRDKAIVSKDPPPIIAAATSFSGDCSDLTIIQPVGTVPTEESLYIWTAVDGADQYILNFSDFQGNYATSITVDGGQNQMFVNTGSLPTGSQLSFQVVAMQGGQIMCSADSGTLTRRAGFVAEEPEVPTEEPKKDKKDNSGYTPPGS